MANHLDLIRDQLGVTITRTQQPADGEPLAIITETTDPDTAARTYELALPEPAIEGQDDAIGAAAYHALRDRGHDLANPDPDDYCPPWLGEPAWEPVADGTAVYSIWAAEVWHPFVRGW